jgi:hypothetical protein
MFHNSIWPGLLWISPVTLLFYLAVVLDIVVVIVSYFLVLCIATTFIVFVYVRTAIGNLWLQLCERIIRCRRYGEISTWRLYPWKILIVVDQLRIRQTNVKFRSFVENEFRSYNKQ